MNANSLPARTSEYAEAHGKTLVIVLSVGVGMMVRLVQYAHNRSLWVDEALLALNVRDQPWGGLFGRLEFNQAAPIGFLVSSKALVASLGDDEVVLRLIPFLSSLAAIALAYPVYRRILGEIPALTGTLLLSLSGPAIYYATEFKQYSTEILVTLGCLAAFVHADREQYRPRSLVILAVVATLAVLFSFPAVFVLTASGGGLLGLNVVRKQSRAALRLVSALTVPALAFTFLFFTSLRDAAASTYLSQFWARHFLPFPPTSPGEVREWLDLPWRLLPELGLTSPALAVFSFCLGAVAVARRDTAASLVIMAPTAAAVGLAALSIYPLGDRLGLYLIPLVLPVVGMGVQRVHGWSPPAAWILLATLTVQPALSVADRIGDPIEREEVRDVLTEIASDTSSGSSLYVHWSVRPAFEYYRPHLSLDDRRISVGGYPRQTRLAVPGQTNDPVAEFREYAGGIEFGGWAVFAGRWPDAEAMEQEIRKRFQLVDSLKASGAYAYEFRVR